MSSNTIVLGNCRYWVSDLAVAKEFYSRSFDLSPHFDEPTWVVFEVHDFELWLEPHNLMGESVYEKTDSFHSATQRADLTYWIVKDVPSTCDRFIKFGGKLLELPRVIGPVTVAIVEDPWGNKLGLYSESFEK